jgi:hypothetical protein
MSRDLRPKKVYLFPEAYVVHSKLGNRQFSAIYSHGEQ